MSEALNHDATEGDTPVEVSAREFVDVLAKAGADTDEARYVEVVKLLAIFAATAGKLPDQVLTDVAHELPHGYVAVIGALKEIDDAR